MAFVVGDSVTFTKTVGETDVYLFAGITGDFNPAHVNEVEALTTPQISRWPREGAER